MSDVKWVCKPNCIYNRIVSLQQPNFLAKWVYITVHNRSKTILAKPNIHHPYAKTQNTCHWGFIGIPFRMKVGVGCPTRWPLIIILFAPSNLQCRVIGLPP